jgi:rhodanese-related sulfurtransferase
MERFLEFAGNHPLLVTLLVGSFLFAVFYELRRKASGLINVDSADAVKLINNDAIVIDLRSAEAYGRGHIVGARNVAPDEIDTRIPGVAQDKTRPVIAVCDNGISAQRTVASLRTKGYESVYNLKGGMTGWTNAGLPVVTGKKTRAKGKGKDKGKKRG